MKREICTGCSLLCDDIIVKHDGLYIEEVIGACLKGKERFDQLTAPNRILRPMIRKDGKLQKVTWDEAYAKVFSMLKNSEKPFFYGFSTISCEAQLLAIELAQKLNGFIDSNSSICQGRFFDEAAKSRGITLSSLSEVINKADLIMLWGANAAESIPRLLNKALFSRGKFRMTGREIKTLVIIDPVQTASFNVMGVRDLALNVTPGEDLQLIRALKDLCCKSVELPEEGVAGIDKEDLKRLLLQLSSAEYGVIFTGQGLLTNIAGGNLLDEFLELIEMINVQQSKGRISLIMMGGHYNMAGFDQVSLSFFGKRGGMSFRDGIQNGPSLPSFLNSGDFDCSFIMGSDPISHLPHKLSSKLLKAPIIVVDNRLSSTTDVADVVLPTAITGIESAGVAIRLDLTPMQLHKIIDAPNDIPPDKELLENILNKFG
jgi:formylmethanofuran dehydrogenase subunit B